MLSVSPSSFLDSDPEPDVGVLEVTADLLLENSGTLFADLLDPFQCETSDTLSEGNIEMSVRSDSDEDEMVEYLSKTRRRKRTPIHNKTDLNCSDSVVLNDCSVVLNDLNSDNLENDNSPDMNIHIATKLNHSRCKSDRSDSRNSTSTEDKCLSKNALQARQNRQKKKEYINELEQDVKKLSNENITIKDKYEVQTKQVLLMQREISYLRSVIANQTGLSALLKNIQSTAGLKFNASFGSQNNGTKTFGSKTDSTNETSSEPETAKECSGKNTLEACIEIDRDNICYTEKGKRKGVYVSTAKGSNKKAKTDLASPSSPSYNTPLTPCASPDTTEKTTGGICLHVSNDKVSLEFCSECAASAASHRWRVAAVSDNNKENEHVEKR